MRLLLPLALFAGSLAPAQMPMVGPTGKQPAGASDADSLKQAGLDPNDGPRLVAYLKTRAVADSDRDGIQALIKQFGADDFEVRLKATDAAAALGPAAVGPLKAAAQDKNPEVAYRAGVALKKLSNVDHSAAAAAAARAVVRLKPPGATGALIGFLPAADSETLADDIRAALVAVAAKGADADPDLLAALADASPVRRSAAYAALAPVKAAHGPVGDAVRKEADLGAKLTGLAALLAATRDKSLVPDVIALLPKLPRGRAWQAEDLLLQISGTFPSGAQMGKTADSVERARAAWEAWWAAKGGDLSKVEFQTRVRGFTEVVHADLSGLGRGRARVLDPDMKVRWELYNAAINPIDVRSRSADRVLVAEANRVTERDRAGQPLATWTLGQSVGVRALPDGRAHLVYRFGAAELAKDGGMGWRHQRPQGDVCAGGRFPNGDTLLVTTAFAGPNAFRLDAKGNDAGKSYTLGRVQMTHSLDIVGDDSVLICEPTQVVQYDLKTLKAVWRYDIPSPTSAQRLTNGNTLIASGGRNAVVEVSPEGTEVWEYATKESLRVSRAYRR